MFSIFPFLQIYFKEQLIWRPPWLYSCVNDNASDCYFAFVCGSYQNMVKIVLVVKSLQIYNISFSFKP